MDSNESHFHWVEVPPCPNLPSMKEIKQEKSQQADSLIKEEPEQLKYMHQIEMGEHETCDDNVNELDVSITCDNVKELDVSLTCDNETESFNVHELKHDAHDNVENETCVDFSSCEIEIKEEPVEELLQDNDEYSDNNVISTKSYDDISKVEKCPDNGEMEDYECAKCEVHFTEKNLYINHLVTHSLLNYSNAKDSFSGEISNHRIKQEATDQSSDQHNMEVEDCSDCGAQFESSHAPSHECTSNISELPVVCMVCGLSCANHLARERHHEAEHQGQKEPKEPKESFLYRCPECKVQFKSRFRLDEHLISHLNANDAKCVSNEDLEQLLTSDGRYPCKVCGKRFAFKTILIFHQKGHSNSRPLMRSRGLTPTSEIIVTHRNGDEVFKCTVCERTFRMLHNLHHHMITHRVEDSPHVCENCGEMFPSAEILDIHVRRRHSGPSFPCAVCGQDFGYQSVMIRHMKTHTQCNRITLHQGVDQEGVITDSNPDPRDQTSSGTLEQSPLNTETQLSDEESLHENTQNLATGEMEDDGNEESQFVPTHFMDPSAPSVENGASGNTESCLQDSYLATDFVCPLCMWDFSTEEQLNTHVLRRHCSPRYSVQCPVCDKMFDTEAVAQIHVQFHLKSQFNCLICGRVSMSRNSFHSHLRAHRKPTKYKCKECGKVLATYNSRRRHMLRRHSYAAPAVKKMSLQVQRGFDVAYDGADELYEPMCEQTNDFRKQTKDPLSHTGKDCNVGISTTALHSDQATVVESPPVVKIEWV